MFISLDISRRYDIRRAPYLTRKPEKAPHFQWRDDRRGERAAQRPLRYNALLLYYGRARSSLKLYVGGSTGKSDG